MAQEVSAAQGDGSDPIALLMQDHRDTKEMFRQFEAAKKDQDLEAKATIVKRICIALMAHAEIEQEIFYPAVGEKIEDGVMDEAETEHASIKSLVVELESMRSGEELFDATVAVLAAYVNHHAGEEERRMFPMVRQANLDLKALGSQMKERKGQVQEIESAALSAFGS